MRRVAIDLFWIYALTSVGISISAFFGLYVSPIITILLTIIGFAFALIHGAVTMGWRQILLLVALTFFISLLFESVGVATGLIYGPYHYTDQLGPKFLGLVPYVISLAWFMMVYPSLMIALRLVPDKWPPGKRILAVASLGAVIMTAWDLVMDPFMVKAGHWVWDIRGAYFGIPLQNYFGWWLTTFVTLGLFMMLSKQTLPLFTRKDWTGFDLLVVYVYAINGFNSILTDYNLELSGPALVGIFAMLPWILLALYSPINFKPSRN
ncbi:MAG: putative rane protein [Chloroflexi bacterium]|nr:putative rane protein [Chloroflexota bacterium]